MKFRKYLTVLLIIITIVSTNISVKAYESFVNANNHEVQEDVSQKQDAFEDDLDLDVPIEMNESEQEEDLENKSTMNDDYVGVPDEREKKKTRTQAETPPENWAFDESSRPLHDEIVKKYGTRMDRNNDGYISISEAERFGPTVDIADIPTLGGTLNGIEYFSNASTLYFMNLGLTGEIPENIGNLRSVNWLYLSQNQLTGEIPESMGNLSTVNGIYLMQNQLTGEIPESMGNLTNLVHLYLWRNELSGAIPESLGNLVRLQNLPIQLNNFSGKIPNFLENFASLGVLNLYESQYTEIDKSTYDFIKNIRTHQLHRQHAEITLDTIGETAEDYRFEAYPAYQQFPEYDSRGQFQYTLQKPDGELVAPTIWFEGSKLVISGHDLNRSGTYVLKAMIPDTTVRDNGEFYGTNYTTTFTIAGPSLTEYLKVEGNGIDHQLTTGTLTLTVSDRLDAKDVAVNLIDPREKEMIHKGAVTQVGEGIYEVTVSGQWREGREVEVTLVDSADIHYTPNRHTTILHRVPTYEVKFKIDGEVMDSEIVDSQGQVRQPEPPPEKEGYRFLGWYPDKNAEIAWDFDQDIMPEHDMVLYAKWAVNEYTVEYIDGTRLLIEQVAYGSHLQAPEATSPSEHWFVGWSQVAGSLSDLWNFAETTMPDHNLKLYAVYADYQIIAHDIEIQLSELDGLTETKILDLAEAHVLETVVSSYALHPLSVLSHNVETKPGNYTITLAMVEIPEVNTDITLTIIDDSGVTPTPEPRDEIKDSNISSVLPQTGVDSRVYGWELILGGIVLLWYRKRQETKVNKH